MNIYRRAEARKIRLAAADMAHDREHPGHISNGDEQKFRHKIDKHKNKPSYLASFTKGMPHDEVTGLLADPNNFPLFVKAIDSGDERDFIDVPLGPNRKNVQTEPCDWKSEKAQKTNKLRAPESQSAGNAYDLEGPDAQAVTMPPAPSLGSDELIAEMGEVYSQALLRDVPFKEITDMTGKSPKDKAITVKNVLNELNKLTWFKDGCRKGGALTGQNAFRGITQGDNIGPYISQFLLAGNRGINSNQDSHDRFHKNGYITYGAVRIDQRVRYAKPNEDYMQNWEEWLDVQNGADLRGLESYVKKEEYRFITTPRDLATYVHYDALYEAYLNACLILLAEGIPFDPGLPFQRDDYVDHQQAFAHFGGPHILSLVTEVATRALKAVRYQKFNVHRRLRPEALAARLANHEELKVKEVTDMVGALKPILTLVDKVNPKDNKLTKGNYLLPMAFCEGSPMHPSYGAGHATVAGACVTILKAFFDAKHPLTLAGSDTKAFVPDNTGSKLEVCNIIEGSLTVEGELNKLASNIAIGRDWAGVHYFTDYIESLRMGEKIAIGILQEQKLTYGENFSMTVPLFDGGSIRI